MKRVTLSQRLQCVASMAAMALLAALLFAPQQAQAQRWLQTTQVIAPIENDGPTRALLDTLINVIEGSDSLTIRRSPQNRTNMTVSDLQDELLDSEGIGISSASHVFLDYRFAVDRDGFEESITHMYFIFRPSGNEEDIPIMYLKAKDEWVRNVLRQKGTTLRTNEAALKPFRDQLSFARIVREQGVQIVEIGDRKVREGFADKKRDLVAKIQRLTYSSR